ncbi:hypothetical protein DTO271G3_914 [Paecilomyces variotii]|nr:hypothetical protein DTO271G3_914 [Paecilomyces variotii]
MEGILRYLRTPGAKSEIEAAAPTQRVSHGPDGKTEEDISVSIGYTVPVKARMLDRWLDRVVQFSGSEVVFFVIISGLVAWALLGIRYGNADSWQVAISDVQAIVAYVFDSFLVRQELNLYEEGMAAAATLQSRLMSHERMLRKLLRDNQTEDFAKGVLLVKEHKTLPDKYRVDFPSETWFGRFTTSASHVFGHLATVSLYWDGVFTWIGIGRLCEWSNNWQLYMNSASSALMVFIFAFLANIRERHSAYMNKCLDAIFKTDSMVEARLRHLTGDDAENAIVVLPAPKVGIIQRAIYYYADFVGTLVGIGILTVVIVVWVAVGPLLHFSSNWWLIIGTYAGLVGMNDGFVLRNMQNRLGKYVDDEFSRVEVEDEKLYAILSIPMPEKETIGKPSPTQKVSELVNKVSSHELTVVAGVLTICGLVAGASAMRWSTTGQLLCNVPPSIIESFFMIVLITGHNAADDKRRIGLKNIYERRLRLLSFAESIKLHTKQTLVETPTKDINT